MLAKVIDIKQETPDTKTLKLKLDSFISYMPGQFVMATIENGGRKITRAYSIANFPKKLPTDEIWITFSLSKGDEIDVGGPFGLFTLDEKEKDFVFIAGGTGIAPLRAMIECLLDKKKGITLLYSVKNFNSIVYEGELNKLAKEKMIKFIPTVTRNAGNWNGRKGRIDIELLKSTIKTGREQFYICGSNDFADSIASLLKELGIDEKQLHTEKW